MAGPTDLFDAAKEYLDACIEAVASTPGGTISRTYVSPGPPAWDCEQLTVYVGGPAEADTAPLQPPLAPGHRPTVQGQVNLVTLTATVLRCVVVSGRGQTPRMPPPNELEKAAQLVDADLWAIWNHVGHQKRNGSLFPPAKTRELFFDPAVALAAQGGFVGWQIQIRVQLDGYAE